MYKKLSKLAIALIMAVSVVMVSTGEPTSAAVKARTYYVKASTYIYKGKSPKSKRVRALKRNQKITTKTNAHATYFLVKVGKSKGYVAKSKLRKK